MAELVISTVVDGILGRLTSVSLEEFASFSGLTEGISGLKETISTLKPLLLVLEKRQIVDEEIRSWLKSVKDAVYDADHFVDYLSTEAFRRDVMIGSNPMVKLQQVRNFFSWPKQLVFRLKMAHKMKEIKGTLAALDSTRMHFDLRVLPGEAFAVTRGRNDTHRRVLEEDIIERQEIIGRKSDEEAISTYLLDSKIEENVCILSIEGMGGVGKTTLAQLVYNDEMVRTHFDLRMWVTVSDDCDFRLLVKKIFESITAKSAENLDMDQLLEEFQKTINGKKYLLVLDDMWDESVWLKMKPLLSYGARGSRIIITTRSSNVASGTSAIPYKLETLTEDDSWYLFKKAAFKRGIEPNNPNIVEIAKEIVKKCGGIPLAIKTLGRLLYFEDSEREWYNISKTLFSEARREERVLSVLKFSFYNLPSHLKHCFAYCSIFEKDYEIDVQTLIRLWVAQGFIYSSEPGKSIEDVSYDYFQELSFRNFLEEIQRDKNGFTKCGMHDLMHDLAVSVAETSFISLPSRKADIDTKTHHLSFNFHLHSHWQIPTSLVQAKRIKTILLCHQSKWETEGRSSRSICGKTILSCKRLRVLDLHNSRINVVPPSIGKLKYLRYLDLSRNINIKTLPNSITQLYLLQTLKLNFCRRLQELPRDIKKVINLINLEIDGCYSLTHMPRGLGQLTNLRTLSEFVLSKRTDLDSRHKGGLDELKNLDNLRGELRIKNLRHGAEYDVANLEKKTQLQSLTLIWNNNDDLEAMKAVTDRNGQCSKQEMNIDSYLRSLHGLKPHISLKELSLSAYGGMEFPKWFSSLTNLVRVSLWRCNKCQYIPPLHQFSSLAVLTLDELTNLEYVSENENNQLSSTQILPSLKELRLTDLPNLKGWWRSSDENQGVDGASSSTKAAVLSKSKSSQPLFSCLLKLIIENCPKLDSMPLYPNLDEKLQLNNSSWKPLQQTMTMSVAGKQIPTTIITDKASSSTTSPYTSVPSTSTFTPLSKLRNLSVVGMMEPDIILNGDVIMWEAFKSLCSLTLDNLPKLKTLPGALQKVNSLQELHICRCNDLEAVPGWIIELKSLKKLRLRLLPNLTSLPQELYGPIYSLEIEDCPKIAQKANPVQDLIIKFLENSKTLLEDY